MSVTIEISELDADLWDAFQRGGPWIAHSEYMQLKAKNDRLRELLSSYWKAVHCPATPNVPRDYLAEMRELGVEVDE